MIAVNDSTLGTTAVDFKFANGNSAQESMETCECSLMENTNILINKFLSVSTESNADLHNQSVNFYEGFVAFVDLI